ncbi:RAS protein activator like-3-like isoform X2 [Synchiropus splendidus]|uniref:RAS protein activator like-3-like isoform X2 n=1 Tax=Synchiropus splendidus TaxID=270530 RepID=UPI00237D6E9C|nr:RAS protein activator like-3-like isoform X2 [Synchiropus splendidus]
MGKEEKEDTKAEQPQKEQGSPTEEHLQDQEPTDPLNTYQWHTDSKGALDDAKEDTGASSTSTLERIQKASATKWNKMQSWRKALSEEHYKSEKGTGGARKNPFRRALSEPPGSLFASLSSSRGFSSSNQATAFSEAADGAGVGPSETSQSRSGGALFRRCLRTVSQKLRKPRLQSRSSAVSPDHGEGPVLSELPRLEWAPAQEVPLWNISTCVLDEGQIIISPDEEPMMWTRNRLNSLSTVSMQNLEDIECSPDHVTLPGGPRPKSQDGGVRALIKRRLENKAKKNSNTQLNHVGLNKFRHYGSRESVSIPVSSMGSLDLSADTSTIIRPVHSSILGEKYCFEVINSENTHCFGCSSAAERDRWIEDLRRAVQPNKVILHLFREEDPKKKRHSKEEFNLHPLGSVAISLADIRGRSYQEKWYPIVPFKPSVGSKDLLGSQASLRIKARFQNLKVLPMEKYKEFAEYVTVDYVDMCTSLEPLLNVKEKEELAGALVHVLQSIGKAKAFLIDLGNAEVQRQGQKEALIFRENTLATKAIDEYMKLVGQKYLINTLGDFIARLYATVESSEVDPRKCSPSELPNNQRHLRDSCDEVVRKITDIHSPFPEELHKIFSSWVELCEDLGRPQIGQHLISASLFLRFLCPAILSPSLFGLTQAYPEPNTLRALTLTAKVIQNLANFTLFGEKEEYMLFMNDFLEQHWEGMRGFLRTVSSQDTEIPTTSFDGYVDLPLRLAVLHGLLVDIINQKKQETIDQLHPLPLILNQITESLGPEATRIPVSSLMGQAKPVYVPPKDLSKYSPHHSSTQQLPLDSKVREGDGRTRSSRMRKPVTRTQSAPHRPPGHTKRLKRQTSSENLPTGDEEAEVQSNSLLISPPKPTDSIRRPPAPVPWIKDCHNRESSENTPVQEMSLLEKHEQELSELRLGVEQVTERELDMAKRLEDFIIMSQDQNTMLQAEVAELKSLLSVREEQLASATFRLGVIEEEREDDERKMNVALAAAERMNVLEEQCAGLLSDLHMLKEAYSNRHKHAEHPETAQMNSS